MRTQRIFFKRKYIDRSKYNDAIQQKCEEFWIFKRAILSIGKEKGGMGTDENMVRCATSYASANQITGVVATDEKFYAWHCF